jgi:hypothetical protein
MDGLSSAKPADSDMGLATLDPPYITFLVGDRSER